MKRRASAELVSTVLFGIFGHSRCLFKSYWPVKSQTEPSTLNDSSPIVSDNPKLPSTDDLLYFRISPYQKKPIQIPWVFEWYRNGTWMVLGGIMAKGIWLVSEWFLNDILESLYRSVVLNGMLNYPWEYHWVLLKYHWMVQWYWMILNGIKR